MSFAPFRTTDDVLGGFVEKSHGHFFEYSQDTKALPPLDDFPVKVWVTPAGKSTPEFRWAKVLKTVAHVVVDEDPEGKPVIEKWNIKDHKHYNQ
ncbi:hypothetical protein PHIM7_234 [Sinorhizobium phage phiM7]|uniref:Uncharacterized protein n=2 Tax=Emdodecavirus TaxID=1980937 RepID=S5MD99_9CAUD|nr:hypothetical protein AB690_gp273 [Sinorhizobium phage phiM12]YP_009601359.1 hypothetical protein FDH46_gp244 [Sinorhizobium phage phiM7]AGR47944.1 hypothetical protein SmphiM12_312 [Sinorhizobium phage phiM12]AKF12779.1 hypothetical protein PHIM7_234 [Sinorhizobium phage phiM7]AKF13140.1 hypothetical protein PHIM19_235 [Sinorhizobium phage phiM19]